jgi:hypothetical protein
MALSQWLLLNIQTLFINQALVTTSQSCRQPHPGIPCCPLLWLPTTTLHSTHSYNPATYNPAIKAKQKAGRQLGSLMCLKLASITGL